MAVPEPDEAYRLLLSNVKCSTAIPEYIQWLLAIRGFCLAAFLEGVVRFFRELSSMHVSEGFARPGTSVGSRPAGTRYGIKGAGRWRRAAPACMHSCSFPLGATLLRQASHRRAAAGGGEAPHKRAQVGESQAAARLWFDAWSLTKKQRPTL